MSSLAASEVNFRRRTSGDVKDLYDPYLTYTSSFSIHQYIRAVEFREIFEDEASGKAGELEGNNFHAQFSFRTRKTDYSGPDSLKHSVEYWLLDHPNSDFTYRNVVLLPWPLPALVGDTVLLLALLLLHSLLLLLASDKEPGATRKLDEVGPVDNRPSTD